MKPSVKNFGTSTQLGKSSTEVSGQTGKMTEFNSTKVSVLPHYCHKMSSSIPYKILAPQVIKLMRQQLCKYGIDASSNLSMPWQYFASLGWKVKKTYFNTKVPLKLNFYPWTEESK